MKKIFFMLMLAVLSSATIGLTEANAQNFKIYDLDDMTASNDTILNSVTTTFTTPQITGGYTSLSATLELTKVSGTAGGTCRIYKSNLPTSGFVLADTTVFTFINTASQGITWSADADALHYRITCVPSGTMAVIPKVKLVVKRN